MKKVFNQIAILILALTLINCSKNDDGDLTPVEQIGHQEQYTRLTSYSQNSKEYSLTYNANGSIKNYEHFNYPGENSLANVEYDANNRIAKNGAFTYTYNSIGKISTILEVIGSTEIEYLLDYNPDGQLTAHTRYTTDGSRIHTQHKIKYNLNNQIAEINIYSLYSTPNYSKHSFTYDGLGNLVQDKNELSWENRNDYFESSRTRYTYDSKKNPIYGILYKSGLTNDFSVINFKQMHSISAGYFYYYPPNNLVSLEVNSVGNPSNNYITTNYYFYNEDNLPTTMDYSKTKSNGETTLTENYKTWTYEIIE
ncbi:MAG: hypothetical protein R3294_15075 [Arenibacter troitsensis]|nr:hypothetical protein [Arenibacter troitsensis]